MPTTRSPSSPRSCGPGDVALVKGSRSVGLERLTDGLARPLRRGGRMIALAQTNGLSTVPVDRGAILIAGMAAMLITIFLGPKFIEKLREREFGQQIREEGPEGHHTKAGTPTMGGLIIFAAISIPYLVLSDRDTESLGRLRCRPRQRRDRVRGRLHQDHQAPLARALRPLEAVVPDRPRGGPLVGRLPGGRTRPEPADPDLRRRDLSRAGRLRRAQLPRARRGEQRRQPHRRARRARRRLLRDRLPLLPGDHDHDRPGGPRPALRLLRRRLGRLPLVQLVPGLDLHGRHRFAGPRRRDRRASRS